MHSKFFAHEIQILVIADVHTKLGTFIPRLVGDDVELVEMEHCLGPQNLCLWFVNG
jgi:hypothetical protein